MIGCAEHGPTSAARSRVCSQPRSPCRSNTLLFQVITERDEKAKSG
jgi:hypothetical protein